MAAYRHQAKTQPGAKLLRYFPAGKKKPAGAGEKPQSLGEVTMSTVT